MDRLRRNSKASRQFRWGLWYFYQLLPGSYERENTGSQWTAACCLRLPRLSQALRREFAAENSLQYPELLDDATVAAGAQIPVPGPPRASSLYEHAQRRYNQTDSKGSAGKIYKLDFVLYMYL